MTTAYLRLTDFAPRNGSTLYNWITPHLGYGPMSAILRAIQAMPTPSGVWDDLVQLYNETTPLTELERSNQFYYAFLTRKIKGQEEDSETLVRLLDTTQEYSANGTPLASVEYPDGRVRRVNNDRLIYWQYADDNDPTGCIVAQAFLDEQRHTPKERSSLRGMLNQSAKNVGKAKRVWKTTLVGGLMDLMKSRKKLYAPLTGKAGGRDRSRQLVATKRIRGAIDNMFARIDKRLDKGLPIDYEYAQDRETPLEEVTRRVDILDQAGDDGNWVETPQEWQCATQLDCNDKRDLSGHLEGMRIVLHNKTDNACHDSTLIGIGGGLPAESIRAEDFGKMIERLDKTGRFDD